MLLLAIATQLPAEVNSDNETEIRAAISEHKWTFVRFYVPWCAYSQIAEPKWNKLSEQYDGDVFFLNVNCQKLGRRCRDMFDVRGYPAFVLYKDGQQHGYFRPTYPREVDVFTEWLRRELERKEIQ